jgi:hypothetical protein
LQFFAPQNSCNPAFVFFEKTLSEASVFLCIFAHKAPFLQAAPGENSVFRMMHLPSSLKSRIIWE